MNLSRIALGAAVAGAVLAHTIGAQVRQDSMVTTAAPAPTQVVYRTPARPNPHLLPITPEHLRTAFKDSVALRIIAGARRAQNEQDAALLNYEARGYQRLSVDLSLGERGRERLAFRREGAIRVRWYRNGVAFVDVEGARAVVPILGNADIDNGANYLARRNMISGSIQMPYYPGRDELWFGEGIPDAEQVRFVHPFADGAESRYVYAQGDSAQYIFPDGSVTRLVEVRITPRTPEWFLVAGSFWFDADKYRLVRAAYRPAVEMNYWDVVAENEWQRIPDILRPLLTPLRGTIQSITVEYGLYEGRFWLPRFQTMQAVGQAAMLRLPLSFEQRYEYVSVNAPGPMPAVPASIASAMEDSIFALGSRVRNGDSTAIMMSRDLRVRLNEEVRRANREVLEAMRLVQGGDSSARPRLDSLRRQGRAAGCDADNNRTVVRRRFGGSVRVLTTVTCNNTLLRNSPSLPVSIYDEDEAARAQRGALERLLERGLQAQIAPRAPSIHAGLGDGLMRYNRVEGFSPGIGLLQNVGAGLTLDAVMRAGTADGELNGELALSHSDGLRTLRAGGYRRLSAANDWGNPLSVGASLQALLAGRDEGFYYRARGAEFIASGNGNPSLELRFYGERQSRADATTSFSIAGALGETDFAENIVADRLDLYGASISLHHSVGKDPSKFRYMYDLRAEHAFGSAAFGRALVDFTVSRQLSGVASAGLTLSGGTSTGSLPLQRQFFLGGTQNVRGQGVGVMTGDAFWMVRTELGTAGIMVRPILFADLGWAGSREDWGRQSRAASGVGGGVSLFDGLIRLDLARGIFPGKAWRFASYLEARL